MISSADEMAKKVPLACVPVWTRAAAPPMGRCSVLQCSRYSSLGWPDAVNARRHIGRRAGIETQSRVRQISLLHQT